MRSAKQIEASRNNGAKSRGPVTPEGKARTRLNGATHGIYSDAVVLNNEDHTLYAQILRELELEWAPATRSEHQLVRDIANANWRIGRFTAFESAALDLETDCMRESVDTTFENIDEATRGTLALNSLVTNNRSYEVLKTALRAEYRIRERLINQLLRLQSVRRNQEHERPTPAPPTTFPKHPGIKNPGTEPEPHPAA